MDDFAAGGYGPGNVAPPPEDRGSVDTDREELAYVDNPNQIVTFAPKEAFRLSLFDVTCIVLNRTIGSGIFNSPQRVIRGTQSTGASLLLWLLGSLYCLSGAHVYIEYGLNVPRFSIDGSEQPVARSGADLNYLQYVYPWPRKDSVFLSTTLFGIAFITLGNMAGNCIAFAVHIFHAADVQNPSSGAVRGVALAVALATCFLHTFSRRGGILLNNVFAIVKVLILLFIIITAILVAARALPETEDVFGENTDPATSFESTTEGRSASDANGYTQAFLAIIFSFSGFEQPNYVLGEVRKPRRYPVGMFTGVALVILLYMGVNLSYMAVVPRADQISSGQSVAQQFFQLTYGALSGGDNGSRIFNALLAVSSLGNIIVMTYTATRVKAEIAKLGIIPFAKFFGQNVDLSLGRALRWFQRRGWFASLLRIKWFSPEQHSEKTPFGALLLHFCCCLVLILATWGLKPLDAYQLLTSLSSYTINGFFGTFLGLGILILRFRGPPAASCTSSSSSSLVTPIHVSPTKRRSWAEMTGPKFKPVISIAAASIYTIGNLWTVVTNWIQPSQGLRSGAYPWWLSPTICWAILGLGLCWFLGFCVVAWSVDRRRHEVFVVEKKPEFDESEGGGGLVLVHETVYLSWVGRETLRSRRPFDGEGEGTHEGVAEGAMYKGSDFDAYFREQQRHEGFRV